MAQRRTILQQTGMALAVPLVLAAGALVPASASAQEAAQPAAPLPLTGRVVDQAQVIAPESEQAMTEMLANLERDTGVQFVVVTTTSLNGMDIGAYSVALGNGWNLGDPQRGNGLLLVVAPGARQARITVGTGLQPFLPDALVAQISQLMVPSFREGNFADGMMIGVVSLDARLRKVALEAAG